MSLRVVQVPDPPPGADWLTVVPGEYLYNVTGIVATLTSPSGPSPIAHDSSGHGFDGTYATPSGTTQFVAGLVAGDLALSSVIAGGSIGTSIFTIPDLFDWANTFTVTFLTQQAIGAGVQVWGFIGDAVPPGTQQLQFFVDMAFGGVLRFGDDPPGWATAPGAVPDDGLAHLIGITFDGATPVAYVDGVAVAWAVTGIVPGVGETLGPLQINGRGLPNQPDVIDEWCSSQQVYTAGDMAALQAARAGGIVTYNAQIMAVDPGCYFHLDDFVAGGPRQVALAVETGITEVMEIPTGFPLATSAGPYTYSWQPNLNSATQNPDGSLTTVAIPALVLPAGYVISSQTPDLTPTDQWSQIRLWWDSNIMDAQAAQSAYLFPPPVHLVYHQEPH